LSEMINDRKGQQHVRKQVRLEERLSGHATSTLQTDNPPSLRKGADVLHIVKRA